MFFQFIVDTFSFNQTDAMDVIYPSIKVYGPNSQAWSDLTHVNSQTKVYI